MKERFIGINRYTSFIPFILISALTFLIYEQTYAPNGIIFPNNDFVGFLFLITANLTLVAVTSYVQRFDKNQTKVRMFFTLWTVSYCCSECFKPNHYADGSSHQCDDKRRRYCTDDSQY